MNQISFRGASLAQTTSIASRHPKFGAATIAVSPEFVGKSGVIEPDDRSVEALQSLGQGVEALTKTQLRFSVNHLPDGAVLEMAPYPGQSSTLAADKLDLANNLPAIGQMRLILPTHLTKSGEKTVFTFQRDQAEVESFTDFFSRAMTKIHKLVALFVLAHEAQSDPATVTRYSVQA